MSFEYEVEVRNTNGNLVDFLRHSIIAINWKYDTLGGCGDATIALRRDFDSFGSLALDYDVRIIRKLVAGDELRWAGFIRQINATLQEPEQVTLSCSGYIRQTEYIIAPNILKTGDMGTIARNLIDDYLTANTMIVRTAGLNLVQDTGITTSPGLRLTGTIYDALRTCADIGGNAEWGVRADREIYFLPRSATTKQTWVIGDRVKFYEPQTSADDLVHRVYIQGAGGQLYQCNGTNQPSPTYFMKQRILTEPALTNSTDATALATSYFAKYNTVQPKGTLRLSATDAWIEHQDSTMPPLGRLRVQGGPIYTPQGNIGTATDTLYRIDSVTYSPGENDLDINIELGERRGAWSDLFRGIETRINDVRSGANQIPDNAITTPAIQDNAVTGQVIVNSTNEITPTGTAAEIDHVTITSYGGNGISVSVAIECEASSTDGYATYVGYLMNGFTVLAQAWLSLPCYNTQLKGTLSLIANDSTATGSQTYTAKVAIWSGNPDTYNKARNAYLVAINRKK